MPDGAGDELCGWARERWPGLPIILLTVRDSTQEVVAGFRNGADDYVTKPFELDVLYSRIQALLRRSLPKNPAFLRCDNIMPGPGGTAGLYGEGGGGRQKSF